MAGKKQKADVGQLEPPSKDPQFREEPAASKIHVAPGKKALAVDWQVLEVEYIGGIVEKNPKGQFERVWPTIRDLAERHGLNQSTVGYQSSRRNWPERRAEFQRTLQRDFDEKLAKSRGTVMAEASKMLDTFVSKFGKAIREDAVPRASIADLERALKLRAWLASEQAASKSGTGIQLSELQSRHASVKSFVEDMDPAMTGIIEGRTEREARAEGELTNRDTANPDGPASSPDGPASDGDPPSGARHAPPSPEPRGECPASDAWSRVAALADTALRRGGGGARGSAASAA